FSQFDREYSAVKGNWLYDSTLYADWTRADVTPINLDGDRSGLYLIMEMTFTSTDESLDLTKCWETTTIKLRSADLPANIEHNYGWKLKPTDPEVTATATPGRYKIAIPLTKAKDNSTGNMDWATTERIITTTEISSVGNYRVRAGESKLVKTISGTRIVDTSLTNPNRFDLAAWIAE
ncbi:MAG: hypothetical protein ACOYJY_06370, partial [Acutalibacteraceae bacterium]